MKPTTRHLIQFFLMLLVFLAGAVSLIQGQESRFVDNKYKISIVPPQGWAQKIDPALVIQFLGKTRSDNTQATLMVMPFDTDDPETIVEALIASLASGYLNNRGGFRDVRTLELRKLNIGRFNVSQLDVTAKHDSLPFLLRFTAIPVEEQKRIYIFVMQDAAKYFSESVVVADASIASFRLLNSTSGSAGTQGQSTNAGSTKAPNQSGAIQQSGPSLEETIDWLKNKLLTESGHRSADGAYLKPESVRFDGCAITYIQVIQLGGAVGNLTEPFKTMMRFSLKDIDAARLEIKPHEGRYALFFYTIGDKEKVELTLTSSPINLPIGSIPFTEEEMANRVLKAFAHAIKLCQVQKEPF